jgi:hypothetical protein
VRAAVEVQLDPQISRKERTRRLEKIATKIVYWQHHAAEAAYHHNKTRRRKLRAMDIDLRKVRRCPLRI